MSETELLDDRKYAELRANYRIQVNTILSAICIGALTFLLSSKDQEKLGTIMLIQLSLSIPVLITSSLAYAKYAYGRWESKSKRGRSRKDHWNNLARYTHSVGYMAVLNAIALALNSGGHSLVAWVFIAVIFLMFFLYAAIDIPWASGEIEMRKASRTRNLVRLSVNLGLLIVGAILPMVLGMS